MHGLIPEGVVGWEIRQESLECADEGTDGSLRDRLFADEDDPPVWEAFVCPSDQQSLKVPNVVRDKSSLGSDGGGKLFEVACPSGAKLAGGNDVVPLSLQLSGYPGINLFVEEQPHGPLNRVGFHGMEAPAEFGPRRLLSVAAIFDLLGVAAVVVESGFKLPGSEVGKGPGQTSQVIATSPVSPNQLPHFDTASSHGGPPGRTVGEYNARAPALPEPLLNTGGDDIAAGAIELAGKRSHFLQHADRKTQAERQSFVHIRLLQGVLLLTTIDYRLHRMTCQVDP